MSDKHSNYDFVLCACLRSGDINHLDEFLKNSLSRSANPVRDVALFIFDAGGDEIEKKVEPYRGQDTRISVHEIKQTTAHPLRQLINITRSNYSGRDMLIVRPGVELPGMWDAGFLFAAYQDKNIATVSPMNPSSPTFFLMPYDAPDMPVDRVNDYALTYGKRENFETESFFESCVYMRNAAFNALIMPEDDKDFVAGLAKAFNRNGYHNVICDYLYVGLRDPELVTQPIKKGDEKDQSSLLIEARHLVKDAIEHHLTIPRHDWKPVQLHITHSWGGGLEKWARDFCVCDDERQNIILKSIGRIGEYGELLGLFENPLDESPAHVWPLLPAIKGSATAHLGYKKILRWILEAYSVDVIYVSSLIGHSMEALETDRRTILICHDYFPYCAGIKIFFDGVCEDCDDEKIRRCHEHNPAADIFRHIPPEDWIALRKRFVNIVTTRPVKCVAPTDSVRRHLTTLNPAFAKTDFRVIPHGLDKNDDWKFIDSQPGERLRIVILGELSTHKGLDILRGIIGDVLGFADVWLVGCGDSGGELEWMKGVTIIPRYENKKLPEIMDGIKPDLGLLLSIWPETFCYTYSELMGFGVPTLAGRVGAFADRIEHGVNGFLCDPRAESYLAALHELRDEPGKLSTVKNNLRGFTHKSVRQMVADYNALTPLPRFSPKKYAVTENARDEVLRGIHGGYKSFDYRMTPKEFIGRSYAYLEMKISVTPKLSPLSRKIMLGLMNAGYKTIRAAFRLTKSASRAVKRIVKRGA